MTGIGLSAFICPSASAAVMSGTAQRTISHPAAAKALIWPSVAATSRLSVLHIDWTEQGAPPPIFTFPTWICLVGFFITEHSSEKRGEKSREVSRPFPERSRREQSHRGNFRRLTCPIYSSRKNVCSIMTSKVYIFYGMGH